MVDTVVDEVAAVVIGRNEGERLLRCLVSLSESLNHIVYVDSGSTDGSVAAAEALGIMVVELDMAKPFTAARARNAGAYEAFQLFPNMQYIQFIDGDCEINAAWLNSAYDFLSSEPEYAIVCGRRRERYPEATVFNLLCDIEWDTPIGDALSCGGDALIRVESYQAVAGYNESLIAGEEPEMCYRLRQQGWKIRRSDEEMTLHDAAMSTLSQWWNRAKRAGYAYANNYQLHGGGEEQFKRREVRSILLWGLVFPAVIFALGLYHGVFFGLFSIYAIQVGRIMFGIRHREVSFRTVFYYSLSTVAAKWPQLFGLAEFWVNHVNRRQGRLIEYK
jgi:glycosyltransferase involved in cell wall biosynthesis